MKSALTLCSVLILSAFSMSAQIKRENENPSAEKNKIYNSGQLIVTTINLKNSGNKKEDAANASFAGALSMEIAGIASNKSVIICDTGNFGKRLSNAEIKKRLTLCDTIRQTQFTEGNPKESKVLRCDSTALAQAVEVVRLYAHPSYSAANGTFSLETLAWEPMVKYQVTGIYRPLFLVIRNKEAQKKLQKK